MRNRKLFSGIFVAVVAAAVGGLGIDLTLMTQVEGVSVDYQNLSSLSLSLLSLVEAELQLLVTLKARGQQ